MFGNKKKEIPQIDKEQLELIKHAQKRIKQKKGLYTHFILFLIGSIAVIVANLGLHIGETYRPLNIDWFVFVIAFWSIFLIYHAFNVYVIHRFMGDSWQQEQLDILVAKQKAGIEKLKSKLPEVEPVSQTTSIPAIEEKKKLTKKQNLTLIVAASENNAIGKDNQLIWHLRDDLQRFKSLTSGHCIIMGRKTFESFPKPLPNRTHIVVTSQQRYKVPHGVIVVHNLDDALDAALEDKHPYVIGGGEIYKQALPFANKIELTRVHDTFDADTHFPELNLSEWREVQNIYHAKDEENDHAFSFITYERI
ncbi:carbohydrate binding module (CBM48) [Formosa agariphila KMM 3901]|uniref:dihydrofolate reductase n=1 Tax=Formosa agariphila (strain DSM 15362 / KCTC 12365 / LMG 23005 / KMM 3901 / M-2Alg 35-1) TaxID=1347342 RepID=T2KHW6_FORAG|nr:dihydrofolate reductase [Formosa agariphila]CDF78008.1 carbohydrate binding module (CBM48) [Formosa agariphila KMM 3901]